MWVSRGSVFKVEPPLRGADYMNPTLCHSVCRDLELVVKLLGILPPKLSRQTGRHTEHLTWYVLRFQGRIIMKVPWPGLVF